MGQFTTGVQASFAPWLTRDPQGVLNNLIVAVASMFEPVAQIVMDSGSPDDAAHFAAGWSALLDPDNAPTWAIPYGAAFVGVQVPPNTPEVDARAIWKSESGFARGTPAAIVSAAKRFLSGTQSIFLLERTPTPYSFVLVVRPEQDVDVTQLKAAVDAVRPAGVTWILIQTDGWAIFQMEASQATITALEGAFATLTGLENEQVGH